jgi:2-dehydro-3-deoxy-D-gluconate 5-dehydrogenase
MKLFDLSGKIALVTGGSTGLGQGMAIGLAEAGADLVLADIVDSGETSETIKTLGRKTHVIVADLSTTNGVNDVIARGIAAFGRVDILVNNAGIIRRTPAIDFAEKDWDDVMTLNAKSVFFLSQGIARDMMKRNEGKIINVASLLSFQGGIIVPSYSASKGAVAQLTKALANEWASSGINVNAIAPGYMETNNTANLRKDPVRLQSISARIPAGRWGVPLDLKGAIIFLASKASDYVHGHILVVDGGWMAR